MKKISSNCKVFLISFLLSLPFWWGINVLGEDLEEFFFWQEMTKNPQVFIAQINQQLLEEKLKSLKPIRDWKIEDLKTEASSAISVNIRDGNTTKVLFNKDSDKKLPIASLTKLMTANIVLESYDLSQVIEISKEAVKEEGEFGKLKIGEIFRVEDLLYPLLMESSNDTAYALAEMTGQEGFVELMNLEAERLGLANTHFFNPTGLDSNELSGPINYSTAEDLIKLTSYLLDKQPFIWRILSTSEFDLYSPDGVYHHKLTNTNELLEEIPRMIGGKTGWTPQASGCLLLVLEVPKNSSYLINVILGSRDRFEEMKQLIEWIDMAYRW